MHGKWQAFLIETGHVCAYTEKKMRTNLENKAFQERN